MENENKSFWSFKKPEGPVAIFLTIAAIFAGVYCWGTIVPFLRDLIDNTLHLILSCVALGAIVFVLTDKQIRSGVWYLYRLVVRGLVGQIINIDPIGILREYIQDLAKKREEASEKIDVVSGSAEKLNAKINENCARIEHAKKLYEQGKKQGKPDQALQIHTIEVGGLNKMNERLVPLRDQTIKIQKFLEKLYEDSGYLIQNMKLEVELQEEEYKAVKAGNRAMKSALAIFKGDPDKRAIFDQALESIADDMALKVGEMKRAMNQSMDYVNSIDLERGVANEEGLKIMQNYDSSKFKTLPNTSVQEIPQEIFVNTSKYNI